MNRFGRKMVAGRGSRASVWARPRPGAREVALAECLNMVLTSGPAERIFAPTVVAPVRIGLGRSS